MRKEFTTILNLEKIMEAIKFDLIGKGTLASRGDCLSCASGGGKIDQILRNTFNRQVQLSCKRINISIFVFFASFQGILDLVSCEELSFPIHSIYTKGLYLLNALLGVPEPLVDLASFQVELKSQLRYLSARWQSTVSLLVNFPQIVLLAFIFENPICFDTWLRVPPWLVEIIRHD